MNVQTEARCAQSRQWIMRCLRNHSICLFLLQLSFQSRYFGFQRGGSLNRTLGKNKLLLQGGHIRPQLVSFRHHGRSHCGRRRYRRLTLDLLQPFFQCFPFASLALQRHAGLFEALAQVYHLSLQTLGSFLCLGRSLFQQPKPPLRLRASFFRCLELLLGFNGNRLCSFGSALGLAQASLELDQSALRLRRRSLVLLGFFLSFDRSPFCGSRLFVRFGHPSFGGVALLLRQVALGNRRIALRGQRPDLLGATLKLRREPLIFRCNRLIQLLSGLKVARELRFFSSQLGQLMLRFTERLLCVHELLAEKPARRLLGLCSLGHCHNLCFHFR